MTRGAHVGFPGGTALTRLDVYDWPAEDGAAGGTPHLHTASTEAYLVIGGRGRVETLRLSGYDEHELEPGDLLWFSPGTIHRLVNVSSLRLLVVMTNAGLPEAGDAVMTFAPAVVADPEGYARAAALDPADPEGSAQKRRDAALAEYGALKAAARDGDLGPLREFQAHAARLVAPRVPHWKELWEQTVLAEAERTRGWLDGLAAGGAEHFASASVVRAEPGTTLGRGMCGLLQTWGDGRQT